MDGLPKEVFNKIKYMTLEHPCTKIIKKAFADYENYWKGSSRISQKMNTSEWCWTRGIASASSCSSTGKRC